MREKHLKSLFGKFGEIINIDVPLKSDNNQNRGFGFVEFKDKAMAAEAIKVLSGTQYKGRSITVEHSMPKGKYD